jgi:hypothetical protein
VYKDRKYFFSKLKTRQTGWDSVRIWCMVKEDSVLQSGQQPAAPAKGFAPGPWSNRGLRPSILAAVCCIHHGLCPWTPPKASPLDSIMSLISNIIYKTFFYLLNFSFLDETKKVFSKFLNPKIIFNFINFWADIYFQNFPKF